VVVLAREIEGDPGNFVVQLLLDGTLVFDSGAQCQIASIYKDGGAARGNAALGQQANDVEDEGVDVLEAEEFGETGEQLGGNVSGVPLILGLFVAEAEAGAGVEDQELTAVAASVHVRTALGAGGTTREAGLRAGAAEDGNSLIEL
jgi:hypothetical protein